MLADVTLISLGWMYQAMDLSTFLWCNPYVSRFFAFWPIWNSGRNLLIMSKRMWFLIILMFRGQVDIFKGSWTIAPEITCFIGINRFFSNYVVKRKHGSLLSDDDWGSTFFQRLGIEVSRSPWSVKSEPAECQLKKGRILYLLLRLLPFLFLSVDSFFLTGF